MNKLQKTHRIIATFFLVIFLPTLLPTNLLYASNNGPNALEAASFEPVDAADMVNLVTGDMKYVLPLLNVPSPEGGYPLSLSYKAGVAMNQEASWVGLGWSLTPGGINRNANGYADDTEIGVENSLIYDSGAELNYYNVGVGANFNGVTLGVGAYWGSHKTFGGSVTLGYGPFAASAGTGTMGTQASIGYSDSVENTANYISTGISLSSIKNNGSSSISNIGTGLSNVSFSYSQDDYQVSVNHKNYDFGIGIYFGHTRINYSLFKEYFNVYSGILYHNSIYDGAVNAEANYRLKGFDTNKMVLFNKNSESIFQIYDFTNAYKYENVLTPNFDSYRVNSQGINGSMSPVFNQELNLLHLSSHANTGGTGVTNLLSFAKYIPSNGNSSIDLNLKLNTKLFFEFNNMNASFLRINRTNIERDIVGEDSYGSASAQGGVRLATAKTNNSNLYSETSANGEMLKNGFRKRTGLFVESFTNQQITSGQISSGTIGFIEAKNLNRNNEQIYKHQSIGAFRITDTQGKTYHYSLPVINFEIWYKNYSNPDDENQAFFEKEMAEPYATDWLLTAVTGPDYIDSNGNHIVDAGDTGFWVEFDYGKWTDAYIWQSSSGNHDIVKGDYKNDDRYEYHRGRKQVYYLDAVRTRTHTAYFVKSLRKDAISKKVEQFNIKATSVGSYNVLNNAKLFQSAYIDCNCKPESPELYNIPTTDGNGSLDKYMGRRENYYYKDFPQNYSLKLDKVILVKNSSGLVINKNQGVDLTPIKKAFYAKTTRIFNITNAVFREYGNLNAYTTDFLNGRHTVSYNPLQEIQINNSANVIDINDVSALNITDYAEKIIEFQHDSNYGLMPNSINSSATSKGKLTLNGVNFLGKKGVSYIPGYQFNYHLKSTAYNSSNEDGWGYHKTLPAAWSLNEIVTPTGAKIGFEYESDDYSGVASFSSRLFNQGLSFFITKNQSTNELNFTVTKNTDATDNVIEDFNDFNDYFKINEKIALDFFVCRRSKYGTFCDKREAKLDIDNVMGEVTAVTTNSVAFKLPYSSATWNFQDQGDGWILNRSFSLTSVKHANGTNDGVIMRNAGYKRCYSWRDDVCQYSNDDINFYYRLASTATPSKGKNGGIRVKTVSVYQNSLLENKQSFYYNLFDFNKDPLHPSYKSSGVTSFAPQKHPVIIPYVSELPMPLVMYKNVSVENYGKSNELLSKTAYSFETLDNYAYNSEFLYSLGDKLTIKQLQDEVTLPNVFFKKQEIKNKLNYLGRILSIKNYNKFNQILGVKKFNYKTSTDTQGELGVKEESFTSRVQKSIPNITGGYHYIVNSTNKVQYSSELESSETQQNGISSKMSIKKLDFLTGDVIESEIVNSNGVLFKSVIKPAYTKYSQMGSKVDNITYRNMLTQTAASYSYIKDAGDWKVTGVGITTWNNEWSYQDLNGVLTSPGVDKDKIWRNHKSYVWNGSKDSNGIFLSYNDVNGNDDDFVWGVGQLQTNSKWKQISEVTLYDNYSMPLEMKDINGNKVATKMDVFNEKIQATGNAAYNEMYYSGAEESIFGYYVGQEIRIEGAATTPAYAHTGKKSVETTNNSKFGVVMHNGHRPGKYKISVWAHKNNYLKARLRWFNNDAGNTFEFNGEKYFAGDWVLLTHYTDEHFMNNTAAFWYVNSIDATTVYFDDLMIRPIASSITGYVYNEHDELTYIIGNNGLATKYEYDAGGRLVKTYIEIIDDTENSIVGGFKLSSENKINYKNL